MRKKTSLKIYNTLFFRIYLYYAIMLAVFAILLGVIFMKLYSESSINSLKDRLENQATNISLRLSELAIDEDYEEGLSYLQILQELGMNKKNILLTDDIWVISNPNANQPMSSRLENISLEDAKTKVNMAVEQVLLKVFDGKVNFNTSFLEIYDADVFTIGVPIRGIGGDIIGAVLINSQVENQRKIMDTGTYLIVISIFVALLISFIIAILFARKLSDPISKMRVTALKLASGNYNVKTEIELRDELGDLAKSIDILSDKLLYNENERMNLEKMRLDFFANVSHELRTPITVVRAYAETLIDGVVTNEDKKKQYYDRMLIECKSMERLVGDLLVLSKMQNPDFAIEKEPINIVQVFDDIIRSANAISKKRNITLKIEKEEGSYMILGDYDRLRQMFMVILDNAVKFSPEESTVYIRLWTQYQLMISIRDEGIGISKEDLPNIFDKFYKSKLRQNAKGSGLGLTIAKQIVLRHGGTIEVTSKPSIGTEFLFCFDPMENDCKEN